MKEEEHVKRKRRTQRSAVCMVWWWGWGSGRVVKETQGVVFKNAVSIVNRGFVSRTNKNKNLNKRSPTRRHTHTYTQINNIEGARIKSKEWTGLQ